MARAQVVVPRTLQDFLAVNVWDEDAVRETLQRRVAERHRDPNGVFIFDETSFPKKGDKTPGVQRQHCGHLGKQENCTVTVHLTYATGDFHTLVDADLYLPKSWCDDRDRCRAAGIPDAVTFRTKPEIAIDLLDRTRQQGLDARFAVADEGYGRSAAFRRALDERGMLYVVEVPKTLVGRTPNNCRHGRKPVSVAAHGRRHGHRRRVYHVKDTQRGPLVWRFMATRFIPAADDGPDAELWLPVGRNVCTREVKYFFSNAASDTPLEAMIDVAFKRWHVERTFQENKSEIGLDHFEVRRYPSLMRHLILSMLSLCFLNEQVAEARGEKSVVVDRADSLRGGRAARSVPFTRRHRQVVGARG